MSISTSRSWSIGLRSMICNDYLGERTILSSPDGRLHFKRLTCATGNLRTKSHQRITMSIAKFSIDTSVGIATLLMCGCASWHTPERGPEIIKYKDKATLMRVPTDGVASKTLARFNQVFSEFNPEYISGSHGYGERKRLTLGINDVGEQDDPNVLFGFTISMPDPSLLSEDPRITVWIDGELRMDITLQREDFKVYSHDNQGTPQDSSDEDLWPKAAIPLLGTIRQEGYYEVTVRCKRPTDITIREYSPTRDIKQEFIGTNMFRFSRDRMPIGSLTSYRPAAVVTGSFANETRDLMLVDATPRTPQRLRDIFEVDYYTKALNSREASNEIVTWIIRETIQGQ